MLAIGHLLFAGTEPSSLHELSDLLLKATLWSILFYQVNSWENQGLYSIDLDWSQSLFCNHLTSFSLIWYIPQRWISLHRVRVPTPAPKEAKWKISYFFLGEKCLLLNLLKEPCWNLFSGMFCWGMLRSCCIVIKVLNIQGILTQMVDHNSCEYLLKFICLHCIQKYVLLFNTYLQSPNTLNSKVLAVGGDLGLEKTYNK